MRLQDALTAFIDSESASLCPSIPLVLGLEEAVGFTADSPNELLTEHLTPATKKRSPNRNVLKFEVAFSFNPRRLYLVSW
jgi:hypothetical protein